jgi:DNA-binding MarR family transcriptional regulator
MKETPRALQASIGFQLNRVAQLFRRELLHALAAEQLQPEQWQVLVALAEAAEPISQQTLVDLTLTDKHTVSRMLARMERDGWVVRVAHPADARSQLVQLSKKAKARHVKLQSAVHSQFIPILSELAERDKQELFRLLLQLRRIMKDTP